MLLRSLITGVSLVVANLLLAFLLNLFVPYQAIVHSGNRGGMEIGVPLEASKVIAEGELARKELKDLARSHGPVRVAELVQFDTGFYLAALLYLWAFLRMRQATLPELYALSLPGLVFVLLGALSWPYSAFFLLAPIVVVVARRGKKGS